MSILTYKVTNLLMTSLQIEDLNITLQSHGGKDSECIISSDSYDRSASLKELLKKTWVTTAPYYVLASPQIHKFAPVSLPPSVPQSVPPSDFTDLQNEIRSMHSRFDEVLDFLRATPAQTAPTPVYVPISGRDGIYPGQIHNTDLQISQPADPMFIPSNILPKDAEVHINANKEESSDGDFDNSLAALKAARKKKSDL